MTMSEHQHLAAVLRYYDETRWDYKHLWQSDKTLAIHFGYYDENARTHREAVERMNGALAAAAAISSSDVVLDAGCGMGGSTIWLAANIGCNTLGINIIPYQLELATAAAQQRNVAGLVRFEARDYTDTALPSKAFTLIWALESVVHAASKRDFASEAFRLLKPGGRVVLAEYMARDDPSLTSTEAEMLQPWLDGWAMPSLLTESAYRQLLGAAGFAGISVTDITDNVRPSLERLGRITSVLLPFAPVLRSCRVITRGQLENARASAAQLNALRLGLWRYKLLVAERA